MFCRMSVFGGCQCSVGCQCLEAVSAGSRGIE